MDSSNKFAIIIPALNPPLRLIDYVKELRTLLKYPIVLVDDGSRQEEKPIFEECKKSASDVTILTHDINRGKGRALKTAFSYLLDKYPDIKGCITCDSDGQHRAVDVVKCLATLENNSEALVLGCRTFNMEHVPWRSRFGNQTMNKLFRIFTKQDFQDTQTGLRAIPTSFMRELIDCPGERFEYETYMLLMIKNRPLVQVPIETIYLDGNSESHFNPIKDSIKISAIIMICDACEAKVRTVSNRTHENGDKAVKEIIEERMEMEQFTECDITFRELDIIRNAMGDVTENESFNGTREDVFRFRHASDEERIAAIAENPAYGRIVCRCETITEGEIIDAIRAPAGARDVDGVKRRTRAGMGRCQGGFCGSKVVEILARELGCEINEITKFGNDSNILFDKTK